MNVRCSKEIVTLLQIFLSYKWIPWKVISHQSVIFMHNSKLQKHSPVGKLTCFYSGDRINHHIIKWNNLSFPGKCVQGRFCKNSVKCLNAPFKKANKIPHQNKLKAFMCLKYFHNFSSTLVLHSAAFILLQKEQQMKSDFYRGHLPLGAETLLNY